MEKAQAGGALAIGVGDKILMLENAVYSILSPEGFASILYKDANKHEKAAEEMKITAKDLKELGIIDTILEEPKGGAHNSLQETAQIIKKEILKNIKELSKIEEEQLVCMRYEKFRQMGRLV